MGFVTQVNGEHDKDVLAGTTRGTEEQPSAEGQASAGHHGPPQLANAECEVAVSR